MLPSELEGSGVSKTVLKSVWSMSVLKVGLGLTSESEVREWFFKHPEVLVHFATLNQQLLNGIQELQSIAIKGLQAERAKTQTIQSFEEMPIIKDEQRSMINY